MPAQKSTARRLNRISMGRAAVMFKRLHENNTDPNLVRGIVLEHLFNHYAKKWKMKNPDEMYAYLFQKTKGPQHNLAAMFEGKTPDEIRDAFFEWRRKSVQYANETSKRMKAIHADPKFAAKFKPIARANIAKATEARKRLIETDPEFTENAKRSARANIAKATEARKRLIETDPAFAKRFKRSISANIEEGRRERKRLLETDPAFAERYKRISQANIKKALEEQKRRMETDPAFAKRASDVMTALWRKPEWRAKQTMLIRNATQRYWSTIQSGLLMEFRSRGLVPKYENRENIAATERTPVTESMKKERTKRVEEAIQKLSPEEAEAITSTFFEGNDNPTTAANMGISLPQLTEIIERAYQKLAIDLKNI